ncbi:MAG TPA: hypothetical protein VJY36_05910 [Candidatus Bathyarchaeia archaeon]|nr:hypothetical protein [Candidatus Bathyarchaeia archaeon]
MKTKKERYTLSEAEIKIAKEIARDNHSLFVLRENLSIKPNLLTHYLKMLQEKGLIKIEKTSCETEKNFKNSKKSVFFQDTKHAVLLKELLNRYSHIKWEGILSGLRIDLLFQLLTDSGNISAVASPVTIWRYLKQFMEIGIITSGDKYCQINERFSLLKEFLDEYQRFIVEKIISSFSSQAVTLWQKDFEFLIRVPQTKEVYQRGFTKTATSRLADYGIQLVSDFDVYFYSKKPKNIGLEDVLLHTLLIEKGNVRYTTYSLLLLKRQTKNIDKDYLLNEAVWYDLSSQINAMFEFLRTKGVRSLSGLPTWNEFVEKMEEYKEETIA